MLHTKTPVSTGTTNNKVVRKGGVKKRALDSTNSVKRSKKEKDYCYTKRELVILITVATVIVLQVLLHRH